MSNYPWEAARLRRTRTPSKPVARVKDAVLACGPLAISKPGSWLIAFVVAIWALAYVIDSRYDNASINAMVGRGISTITIDSKRDRVTSIRVKTNLKGEMGR
jgi:hypothetical protein